MFQYGLQDGLRTLHSLVGWLVGWLLGVLFRITLILTWKTIASEIPGAFDSLIQLFPLYVHVNSVTHRKFVIRFALLLDANQRCTKR